MLASLHTIFTDANFEGDLISLVDRNAHFIYPSNFVRLRVLLNRAVLFVNNLLCRNIHGVASVNIDTILHLALAWEILYFHRPPTSVVIKSCQIIKVTASSSLSTVLGNSFRSIMNFNFWIFIFSISRIMKSPCGWISWSVFPFTSTLKPIYSFHCYFLDLLQWGSLEVSLSVLRDQIFVLTWPC